ncbi:hypothetical protein CCH79_00017648 [Gambusia affinis]|uniref:Uncharacterized protein n=1 Tax=Gambusia affinis TaxID=33528 RepID=A0A315W472_GAMAF|nr:hypothetical protein CCH79_00017648 [Gambusia affinis]
MPLHLPVTISCFRSPTGQKGLIGLLLQPDGIPHRRCPPTGSRVAAVTGTDKLVARAPTGHLDNGGTKHEAFMSVAYDTIHQLGLFSQQYPPPLLPKPGKDNVRLQKLLKRTAKKKASTQTSQSATPFRSSLSPVNEASPDLERSDHSTSPQTPETTPRRNSIQQPPRFTVRPLYQHVPSPYPQRAAFDRAVSMSPPMVAAPSCTYSHHEKQSNLCHIPLCLRRPKTPAYHISRAATPVFEISRPNPLLFAVSPITVDPERNNINTRPMYSNQSRYSKTSSNSDSRNAQSDGCAF